MPAPANELDAVTALAHSLGIADPPAISRLAHETPDGTISALRWGTEPPAVAYLHGAGLNAHTWDTAILASGLPSLALDLPGHGDSSWRDDADYSPRTIAPAVAEALAALSESPLILVGHSLGGLTASVIAAARPELVQELVIVDITPGIDQSAGPAALREFYAITEFPSREAVVDRATAFGLGGDRSATERGVFFNTRVREDGVVEWKHHFAKLATLLPASTAAAAPSALLSQELWDDIERIAVPTTLIRAERGFVTENDAAEFRSHLPHTRVLDSDTGHNIQETRPHELAQAIRTIASETPIRKGQS